MQISHPPVPNGTFGRGLIKTIKRIDDFIQNFQFTIHYSLFIIHYSLFTIHHSLSSPLHAFRSRMLSPFTPPSLKLRRAGIRYSLLTIHYSPFTIHHSLFTSHHHISLPVFFGFNT